MAQVQKHGRTDVLVDSSADAVWQVLADVTRTGEWSHEVGEVRWLGGAVAAAPGVRFRGRNHAGWVRWGRTSEVLRVDAPCELAWRTVPTPLYPDSTEWSVRLQPVGDRTRIVQEFTVLRVPRLLEHLYAALVPAHRDRTERLTADLQRLGAVAGHRAAPSVAGAPTVRARRRRLMLKRQGNRIGVWLYRRLDGRLASGRRGVEVLLLTAPGRRSGQPRSTCVRYLRVDGGMVVWGTGSGSHQDPDWFENVRAADALSVQLGAKVIRVSAQELTGADRDRMWEQVVLARAPEVAKYARRAARTIPVAVLTPVPAGDGGDVRREGSTRG
jgi:deazaflavin-dependent oxidoreductase (nitroreductase family)